MSQMDAEGAAAAVCDRYGLSFPVSPWEAAAEMGVRVEAGARGERASAHRRAGEGWVITVDDSLPPRLKATRAGHELGHCICEDGGVEADDAHAWWAAAELLLPRLDVLPAWRAGATVEELVQRSPFVSNELVARRIVSSGTSLVAWVWDTAPRNRRPYRVTSPGWRWPRHISAVERSMLEEALATNSPVEPMGGTRAWVVEEGGWRRALLLADGEVLMSGLV